MHNKQWWIEFSELVALFFIQAMAMGMWFVPLSAVLDAHDLHEIKAYAFATAAIAAFVSPLIFGAMADHLAAPVKVLRGLAVATSLAMALASTAIKLHWNPWVVLATIQLHALCTAPTWSISSTIVFSRLSDSKKQFGPIRAMATLGWMAGCGLISLVNADATTLSGYSGSVMWLIVAGFTFFLPQVAMPKAVAKISLKQRLGLDALTLLKNPDHRVVFITAALFSVPIAAFYPFTPPHLRELGLLHSSAWMALGQVTEIIALFGLAHLLGHWRLKWVFGTGIAFGVIRFACCAVGTKPWLLTGIILHGFSFALFFITCQIYLDERVPTDWRARAQALLALITGGVGNLTGYLGVGWWHRACTELNVTRWPLFWGVLSAASAVVLVYFLTAYHGRGVPPKKVSTAGTLPPEA